MTREQRLHTAAELVKLLRAQQAAAMKRAEAKYNAGQMDEATAYKSEGCDELEAAADALEASAAPPNCPKCGLPMSFSDQPIDEAPQYICDGPNDRTSRTGCGEALISTPSVSFEERVERIVGTGEVQDAILAASGERTDEGIRVAVEAVLRAAGLIEEGGLPMFIQRPTGSRNTSATAPMTEPRVRAYDS